MSKRKKKDEPSNQEPGETPFSFTEFLKDFENEGSMLVNLTEGPGETQLADKITRMIEPFYDDPKFDFDAGLELLLDLATIAWNDCVEEDFGVVGADALNDPSRDFSDWTSYVDKMKARKRSLYPNFKRHIMASRAYFEDDGFVVNVTSDMGFPMGGGDLDWLDGYGELDEEDELDDYDESDDDYDGLDDDDDEYDELDEEDEFDESDDE
jgi:hypothetical protein